MKQVRLNTFETNSSSVHALCIAKQTTILPPSDHHSFFAAFGEYGRWNDKLNGLYHKLSYLYTLIDNIKPAKAQEYLQCIEHVFLRHGCYCDWERSDNHGFIDHGYEWNDVPELDELFHDEEKLERFLFGKDSFVLLGDDDSDMYFEKMRETKRSDDYEVIEQ